MRELVASWRWPARYTWKMQTRRLMLGLVLAPALGSGTGCPVEGTGEAGTDAWMPTDADDEQEADDDASTSGGSSASSSNTGSNATTTSGTSTSTSTSTATVTATEPTTEPPGETSTGETVSDCTPAELELIELTNAYRAENGLPAIPASPSLCIVGHTHAEDLAANAPHESASCNLHSWSDAGPWSGCCYTSDHAQAECMWAKPSELTDYPGNGYENAAWSGGAITPTEALELWKSSGGHNAVILNQGTWANIPWGSMGAGIHEGFAVLWFGEEADPAG